jgi:hypothetical protein
VIGKVGWRLGWQVDISIWSIVMTDWYKLINSSTFNSLAIDGFPNWDKDRDGNQYFVMFEIVNSRHLSSYEMTTVWDDKFLNRINSDGMFYYRDWTSDGIPFIADGEKYWAGFWFKYKADAGLFGGAASWEMYFDQLQGKMQAERGQLCAYPLRYDHLER